MPRIAEFHQYITPDGNTYEFHTVGRIGRWVISSVGWGIPPISYITQSGPFQHGGTVRDFFLQPRTIQLVINQAFCDRDGLWAGRSDLLDNIRPNRQAVWTAAVPGQLRRFLSDGSLRDLDVFITNGPEFDNRRGGWQEWSFQELLRFTAFNPVIYDPTLQTTNWTVITPPAPDNIENIVYTGTWEEYPTLIITGPVDNPIIDNIDTGEKIELTYNIPAGRIVTITLTYGDKTVVDDLGVNLIGTVTTDSDLATFHMSPAPEVADGSNSIRFRGSGSANGATAFTVTHRRRYIGI